MKKIILDTNAYTALMTGREEILDLMGKADEVLVPIFVLGELLFGFKNGSREKENSAVLLRFLNKSTVKIVHTTIDTAEIFGRIKADLKKSGSTIPVNDVWIASQAIESGAFLVTYDSHFDKISGLLLAL